MYLVLGGEQITSNAKTSTQNKGATFFFLLTACTLLEGTRSLLQNQTSRRNDGSKKRCMDRNYSVYYPSIEEVERQWTRGDPTDVARLIGND